VGTAHLLSWRHGIWAVAGYIADYLRLQAGRPATVCSTFAAAFGSHAWRGRQPRCRWSMVWFVDLNPHKNRAFVAQRAQAFGLSERLRVCRDLGRIKALPDAVRTPVDLPWTLLEHLPDPRAQLKRIAARMNPARTSPEKLGISSRRPPRGNIPSTSMNRPWWRLFRDAQKPVSRVFHPLLSQPGPYRSGGWTAAAHV